MIFIARFLAYATSKCYQQAAKPLQELSPFQVCNQTFLIAESQRSRFKPLHQVFCSAVHGTHKMQFFIESNRMRDEHVELLARNASSNLAWVSLNFRLLLVFRSFHPPRKKLLHRELHHATVHDLFSLAER